MIFSKTRWIRNYAEKLDAPLRNELVNCYRHNRHVPCFLHGIIDKTRYRFKRMDVIVRFTNGTGPESSGTIKGIQGIKLKKASSRLGLINSWPARLSMEKIQKLLQSDRVERVYLDRRCRAFLDTASPTLGAKTAQNLGLTGKGITTAVIDTGIYPHDDLIRPHHRILAFKDFVHGKAKPYDDNGHGTHVAGDIASNGWSSDGLYKAPAYESLLVGVKVLDKLGTGSLSNIIAGIEWCTDNKEKYSIRTLCLSLGSEAVSSYKDDLLCEAVEAAWKDGLIVCAAAGNSGPEPGTIASPGIDPMIITVGASDDKNTPGTTDDAVADFSSRGPTIDSFSKPDIVCPGANIISLRAPNSYLDRKSSAPRVGINYVTLSGSSMAAPLCCSCAALLLEKNPRLTPNQAKDIMVRTAVDLGFDKNTQGSGLISVVNMLDIAAAIQDPQTNPVPEGQPTPGNCPNSQTDPVPESQPPLVLHPLQLSPPAHEAASHPPKSSQPGKHITVSGLVISSDETYE